MDDPPDSDDRDVDAEARKIVEESLDLGDRGQSNQWTGNAAGVIVTRHGKTQSVRNYSARSTQRSFSKNVTGDSLRSAPMFSTSLVVSLILYKIGTW